jgi:diguanylate cyclase (GGDEF)-like protein
MSITAKGIKPVLIFIDDNYDWLATLTLAFAESPFEVRTYTPQDMHEGMRSIEGPAMVYVDMNLETQQTGIEVIHELERISRYPTLYSVMSSRDDVDYEIDILKDGLVDRFVTKTNLDLRLFLARVNADVRMFHKMLRGFLDNLTQALTREAFEQAFKAEAARHLRGSRRLSGAIMLLDVDNFKTFNDRFGHAFGDKVLQTVAHTLQDKLRASDILCRWGGDEFVILLSGRGASGIKNTVHRVMKEFDNIALLAPDGTEVGIGASIGTTVFDYTSISEDSIQSLHSLIEGCDTKMYDKKKRKK